MKDKNFTTFEQQIDILKNKRKLSFVNEEAAFVALRRFGYYSIINGYKDPYIDLSSGEEVYKESVTFEQIFSLYKLDRNLRNSVMDAMLEIEDNLCTAIAHVIAEAFTAEESKYLLRTNYRSGKTRNGTNQLDSIMTKFDKILHDDTIEPIKHYREEYGNVPPWILLKSASFGNLVNFYKLLRPEQKNKVISMVYDMPLPLASIDEVKMVFNDTIFVCHDYRNRAAHGGRIYNYQTNATFRKNHFLHEEWASFRTEKGFTGLPVLVDALKFFDNQHPRNTLIVSINYFLNEHLKQYPEDTEYLKQYLEIIDEL